MKDKNKTKKQLIEELEEMRLKLGKLKELKDSHLHMLMHSTAEAIYGLDTEGNCTFCNAACLSLLGHDNAENLIGENMHSLIHHTRADGTEYPLHECRIYQAFLEGDKVHVDNEVLWRSDGSSFPAEYWSYPIIEEGRIIGSVVTFIDISERKRAQMELAEKNRVETLYSKVRIIFTEEQSLQVSLKKCAEVLVSDLDVLFARIWLFNDCENVLELNASEGIYTHLDGHHGRIKYGEYKIGRIAKEMEPHLTNNVIGDPGVHDQEWAKREKVVSFAGHPLVIENRLIGVMAVFSRNVLSINTAAALAAVADIIALGVERSRAEQELKDSEEKYRLLSEAAFDGVALTEDGILLDVNKKMASIFGYGISELNGFHIEKLIAPECLEDVMGKVRGRYDKLYESVCLRKDGTRFPVEVTGKSFNYINSVRRITAIRDISDRKEMERKLNELATLDDLTGLLNRRGFFCLAEQQCRQAARHDRSMALVYIDIDGFKSINDRFGHKEGDQAIIDTAGILKKAFRQSDIIGRLGGDEFGVLLTELTTEDMKPLVNGYIEKCLKEYNESANRKCHLSFSFGLANYDPLRPCSVMDLVNRADAMMYDNKKQRRLQGKEVSGKPQMQSERRKNERFRAENRGWVYIDGTGKSGLKDISLGGLCVFTSQELIAGRELDISIYYNSTKIGAKGRTVWSASSTGSEPGMAHYGYEAGIEFASMGKFLEVKLNAFISKLSSQN